MKYLLILLLISQTVLADDQPVYLPKNTPAPYNGYLVPEKTVNDMRNTTIELDAEKKINSMLTDEQAVMNERLTNSKNESDTLSKELASERSNAFLTKVGFFVLGAAAATLVAYGTVKTLR
jgi:hypothetical protein